MSFEDVKEIEAKSTWPNLLTQETVVQMENGISCSKKLGGDCRNDMFICEVEDVRIQGVH